MIDDFLAFYRTTRVGNWQAFLNFHNIYASPSIDEAKLTFDLSIIKDSAARQWMDGRIDDRAWKKQTLLSPVTTKGFEELRWQWAFTVNTIDYSLPLQLL
jgi:hypothetical protein